MKIRGERECRDCGARWSYYETGSVACPDCESLRSVGVDDRTAHTDSPATLDVSSHREAVSDADGRLPSESVDGLKRELREYVRKRGFIRGGELRPLDDTYLTAQELLEAADAFDRLIDPTDSDREYLLALLAGVEAGDRPPAAAVPESLREARGMAAASAVDAYRTDLLSFLDELDTAGTGASGDDESATGSAPPVTVEGENPAARIAPARAALERLRDRTKRVEALHGDVDPEVADGIVDAADAIGEYVRTGTEASLATARARIDDSSSHS
ncbi:hypothetical protein JCM18237_04740 [Halorubrum luteum]